MKKNSTSGFISGIIALTTVLICAVSGTSAQMIQFTESFDQAGPYPANDLPYGWSQGKVVGASNFNTWDRLAVGVNATCSPRTGAAMLRYRAYNAPAGEAAFVASKPFDLSNRGALASNFRFWLYKDNGYLGTNDRIEVYINNAPNLTGATLLADTANALTAINRPCNLNPVVTCQGPAYFASNWKLYGYTIPAGAAWTNANVYVIIKGYSQFGNNIHIDDFSIDTYPTIQSFTSASLDQQNVASVGPNTTNNWVAAAKIVVTGATGQLVIDSMVFATNGTTNPSNDIQNAKLWWTGGTNAFVNPTQVGATVATPNSNYTFIPTTTIFKNPISGLAGANTITVPTNTGLVVGMRVAGVGIAAGAVITNIAGTTITLSANNTAAVQYSGAFSNFFLENGPNYFWVTYDVKTSPPAVSGDCVDADFVNLYYNMVLVPGPNSAPITITPTPQTLAGCRPIDVVYCGGAIPLYFTGTSWAGYNNNDYISRVTLAGDPTYPPGINNLLNSVGPNAGGCTGGPCPFSVHPPDYEKFPAVPGKTAVLKADGVTNYNILACVGTYFSGNCLAAWIDFDHDGVFNNATYVGTIPGPEKLLSTPYPPGLANSGCNNNNFIVPTSATFFGNTTLRVRETWINNNIDPCATYTYGEVEDYTITIIPDCNIIPTLSGWKVWLGGFSNDWNVAANWCGGVPSIANDAAVVPLPVPALYQPVIKAGVAATCRKLRIEGADTVTVNAYTGGSLTIADSVTIKNSNSLLRVISTFSDTTQVSNGVLYNANYNIFVGSKRQQRMQIVYSQADLLAKGWLAGDVIDQMIFNIAKRNSTGNYANFTVHAFYGPVGFCFSTNNYQTGAAVAGSAAGLIFTGTPNLTGIPLNGAGQYTINLTNPFTWNGGTAPLIIDIRYSLPATITSLDQTYCTQTLGCKTMLVAFNVFGATGLDIYPGVNTATGTPTIFTTDYRPNITYHIVRPYSKVPITVGGSWSNNGTVGFIPGYSKFTFNGANPQNIGGTTPTNFYDLWINNTNAASGVTLFNNITVLGDTLRLVAGRLRLSTYLLTHNNNLATSVSRVNGWLQSETAPPTYGRFNWKMGSTTGPHVVPFGNAAGAYIPFTFDPTAGTSDVTFATYATPPNNTPYPTGVLNVNNFYTNLDNSANTVDRFWQIDNTGAGTTANLTFTYAPAENAATGNVNMRAQRWDTSVPKWADPSMFIGQSNPTAQSVLVPNVTQFSPWAITNRDQPLPVELVTFNAKAEKDKVRLFWTTASEFNNDFFTVERTTDISEYSFIDKVNSRGNSNSITEYYTYDYKPLNGLQYYRLKQTDRNGAFTYSNLVPVSFNSKKFEIITVAKNDDQSQTVYFNYDSNSQVSYKLIDMLGRTVVEKNNIGAIEGINTIEIKSNVGAGIYTFVIFDSTRNTGRKILFQ